MDIRTAYTMLQSLEVGQEVTLTRDVTTARWTFIIGRDGRIVFKETEVDPQGDSKAVLAAIERLARR